MTTYVMNDFFQDSGEGDHVFFVRDGSTWKIDHDEFYEELIYYTGYGSNFQLDLIFEDSPVIDKRISSIEIDCSGVGVVGSVLEDFTIRAFSNDFNIFEETPEEPEAFNRTFIINFIYPFYPIFYDIDGFNSISDSINVYAANDEGAYFTEFVISEVRFTTSEESYPENYYDIGLLNYDPATNSITTTNENDCYWMNYINTIETCGGSTFGSLSTYGALSSDDVTDYGKGYGWISFYYDNPIFDFAIGETATLEIYAEFRVTPSPSDYPLTVLSPDDLDFYIIANGGLTLYDEDNFAITHIIKIHDNFYKIIIERVNTSNTNSLGALIFQGNRVEPIMFASHGNVQSELSAAFYDIRYSRVSYPGGEPSYAENPLIWDYIVE